MYTDNENIYEKWIPFVKTWFKYGRDDEDISLIK
jgi:general stress protein 26